MGGLNCALFIYSLMDGHYILAGLNLFGGASVLATAYMSLKTLLNYLNIEEVMEEL